VVGPARALHTQLRLAIQVILASVGPLPRRRRRGSTCLPRPHRPAFVILSNSSSELELLTQVNQSYLKQDLQ
jgi:hypothetical protein